MNLIILVMEKAKIFFYDFEIQKYKKMISKKIYIIEEPEKSFICFYCKKIYISALLQMNPSQLIITTHSPYTIDFEKVNQIIKISCNRLTGDRIINRFDNINNEDFKKNSDI
ncbi:MAG: hypothetical protein L6V81_09085 [Clostridium sp.]|nr:MAG: hypothetical protein L6V81_09085 [Clostridium sp.]